MQRMIEFIEGLREDIYPEHESSVHRQITEWAVKDIVARFPAGMRSRALDVGYGLGIAHKLFKDSGFEVCSITLSKKEQETGINLGQVVLLRDQNNFDMDDEYFHIVYARHVIEHSPIPFWTLHEYKRLVKEGGFIYIEVPAPGTSCHHETNQNHYSVLTNEAWLALIFRTGLEVIDARQWNMGTPVGPDTYFSYLCQKPNNKSPQQSGSISTEH